MCVDHSPVDTRVATHVMQGAEDYQTIVRIVQKIILIMKLQIFTEDLLFFLKKNVLSVQASNPELPCALVNCGGHFSL